MILTPSRFLNLALMGMCSSGNLVEGDFLTDGMRALLVPNEPVGPQRYRLMAVGSVSFPPGEIGDYLTSYLSQLEAQVDSGWPLVDVLKNLYLRTFQETPADPKQAELLEAHAQPFLRDAFDGIYTWLIYRSQSVYLAGTHH